MSYLQSFILGLVQGIAEFLPISSSGHLVLFQNYLGLEDTSQYLFYNVLLHVGTLVSVIFFYYKDIWKLILAFFEIIGDLFKGKFSINKTEDTKMLSMLFVATIPLILVLPFKSAIEMAFDSQNVMFVGLMLLVTATLLFIIDDLPKRRKEKRGERYKRSLIVGLCQMVAVLPGLSRSGATIFGARVVNFNKEFAVKFSLLMSMIAILGATASEIPDLLNGGGLSVSVGTTIVGMLTAAISGIFSIRFLVKTLNRGKFKYFSYYCGLLGIIVVIMQIYSGYQGLFFTPNI